jgi:hypothetical protein
VTRRRPVLRIVLLLPNPTALNFLAGLFAGAGINMLTSTATGESSTSAGAVALDAVVWVAAAVFMAWVAHRLDAAQRQASFFTTNPYLEPDEKRAEYEKQLDETAPVTALLLGLTLVCLIAATLLLPGLIDWAGFAAFLTFPPSSPTPSS